METFQNGISSAQLKLEKRTINRCKCKTRKQKQNGANSADTNTQWRRFSIHLYAAQVRRQQWGRSQKWRWTHSLGSRFECPNAQNEEKRNKRGGNIINAAMNFGVAVVFAVARCLSACIPACHDRPIAIHADVFLGALVPQGGTMGHICTRTDTHY